MAEQQQIEIVRLNTAPPALGACISETILLTHFLATQSRTYTPRSRLGYPECTKFAIESVSPVQQDHLSKGCGLRYRVLLRKTNPKARL